LPAIKFIFLSFMLRSECLHSASFEVNYINAFGAPQALSVGVAVLTFGTPLK